MAKHRLEDRDATVQFGQPVTAVSQGPQPSRKQGLFRRKQRRDDLFERSFRMCMNCGADVYVLASSCKNCERKRTLTPAY